MPLWCLRLTFFQFSSGLAGGAGGAGAARRTLGRDKLSTNFLPPSQMPDGRDMLMIVVNVHTHTRAHMYLALTSELRTDTTYGCLAAASPPGVALASSRRSTSLKVGRASGFAAQQSRASAPM